MTMNDIKKWAQKNIGMTLLKNEEKFLVNGNPRMR